MSNLVSITEFNITQQRIKEHDMKRILAALLVLALVFFVSALHTDAAAQTTGKQTNASYGPHGPIDSDGDGIPNHSDLDFKKPQDGTGNKFGKAHAGKGMMGKGNGAGQGLRNGNGAGNGTGTGICDGTGPKGGKRGR